MLFAPHSLAVEAVLVTDNTAEFARVAGLPVEHWLRPTTCRLVAVALLIALAATDRGLSALWPATYGRHHPLAAIAVTTMPLLAGHLILRR